MKTKLRTMLLAAAGVLGSVAVAHAQPAPAPPPAPAAAPVVPGPGTPPAAVPPAAAAPAGVLPTPATAAQPAPAPVPPAPVPPGPAAVEPVGVAPAALPAAPPPVAAAPVNWGGAPPAPDTVKPAEAPKKANPFGFTRFTWNNSASTKIFGVGGDYNGSEDEVYSMDFGLNIRYTFFSRPKTKIFVNVAGGVEVELTNSDSTTTKREPRLRDTSAGIGISQRLFTSANKETSTSLQVVSSALLPTSLLSQRQGRYLGTNLSASIFHLQNLAGSDATWFQNVFLLGSVGWGHTFSRAYTPTSTELAVTQRPRQVNCNGEAGCSSDSSDQLSNFSLAHDSVRFGGAFYLSVYKDVLSFGNYWEISERYRYGFKDACVELSTVEGCAPAGGLSNPVTRGAVTTFDLSFSYNLMDNLGRVDLGYTNTTNQLGENGQRRSAFYSPDAQFYMNVAAYLDGIYDKASSGGGSGTKQRVGSLPRFRFQ